MNLTEKALSAAKTIGGKSGLNCIAELDPTAIEQAKKYESNNDSDLPLAGIPVLVKDNIDVKGLHTTAGSLALTDNLARSDAPIITNLRRNGAVILGKTNLTEFANYVTDGMPGGYSSRGGQVIHAVNPELSPSGSSSGSAVAVSAGIVSMAVGTDTCFSIIQCAAANGICGLKPPIGQLSQKGIIPIASSFDSAGPLAHNLSDALKLYSGMRDDPLPALTPARLDKLKIAVNRAGEEMIPKDMLDSLRQFIHQIEAGGAEISEVTQKSSPEMGIMMKWEFKPMLEAYLKESGAYFKTLDEIVKYYESHPDTMMKYGDSRLRASLDETPGSLQGKPYLEAVKVREKTIERISNELSTYDAVIVTGPTDIMHFCGMPSVTIAGNIKTDDGINQTLILYGWDEYRLYEAALALERLMLEM